MYCQIFHGVYAQNRMDYFCYFARRVARMLKWKGCGVQEIDGAGPSGDIQFEECLGRNLHDHAPDSGVLVSSARYIPRPRRVYRIKV